MNGANVILKASNSVEILDLYKQILVDQYSFENVVVDLSNFRDFEETDARIINKFKRLSKEKGLNVKFVNARSYRKNKVRR